MAESANICHAFFTNRLEEVGPCRVVAASKHEILPDEDSKLVAKIVEDVLFPNPSAPDSRCSVRISQQLGALGSDNVPPGNLHTLS